MYNFHYQIDMEVDLKPPKPRARMRVAICAQEWQDRDVPDAVRYQLLWRAVASQASTPPRFVLSKNFSTYRGHFPCELRPPPPWRVEKTV